MSILKIPKILLTSTKSVEIKEEINKPKRIVEKTKKINSLKEVKQDTKKTNDLIENNRSEKLTKLGFSIEELEDYIKIFYKIYDIKEEVEKDPLNIYKMNEKFLKELFVKKINEVENIKEYKEQYFEYDKKYYKIEKAIITLLIDEFRNIIIEKLNKLKEPNIELNIKEPKSIVIYIITTYTKSLARMIHQLLKKNITSATIFYWRLGDLMLKRFLKEEPYEKKDTYKVGNIMASFLIKIGILQDEIQLKNKTIVPMRTLELLLNIKDLIFPVNITTKNINSHIIKENEEVHTTEKLVELINESNKIQYAIDKQFFNMFLEYYNYITENNASYKEKSDFIKLVYNVIPSEIQSETNRIFIDYATNTDISFIGIQTYLALMLDKYLARLFIGKITKPIIAPVFQTYRLKNKRLVMKLGKVISHKYMLSRLINQLALLSKFNHFFIPKSIRYIGRLFSYNTNNLNLQEFKLAKAFIMAKVFTKNELTFKEFICIKLLIKKVLKYNQEEIMNNNLNYEEYKKENKRNIKELLLNSWKIIDENILINQINKKDKLKDIIEKVYEYIKHPEELILAIHQIYRYKYPHEELSLYYNKDATASGLQITAMLFRDKDLANKVNLIGYEKQDIYSLAAQYFMETLNSYKEHVIWEWIKDFPKLKEILESRDLYKKVLMTYGYGMGKQLRIETFKEVIEELLMRPLPEKAMFDITKSLSDCFEQFVTKYLPVAKSLRKIGLLLAKRKDDPITPFNIKTPYLSWKLILNSFKYEDIVIRDAVNKRLMCVKYKIYDNVIDKRRYSQAFVPLFVHSADAFIAMSFLERCIKLSNLLEVMSLPKLNYYVNHDCFYVNITYNHFLTALVRDCYVDFYHLNYLQSLYNNCPSKSVKTHIADSVIKRTNINYLHAEDIKNPNFIKL